MKILICGAQGFIGRHISKSLQKAGHEVCHGVRRPQAATGTGPGPGPAEIAIDYAHDTDPAIWETRLRQLGQIDVVINAVGILNETDGLRFDAIHRDAPVALFSAAAKCGVKSVVQISALGGRQEAERPEIMTGYMKSKRAADKMLMESRLTYLVLRPSLVVGVDGGSSQLFRMLASLPVLGLPGRGEQQVQPVHMDDLCSAINIWLANENRHNLVLNAVGPQAMSYRHMLEVYRQAMGMPAQYMFPIPMSVMRVTARLATLLPQKTLAPDSLDMLEQHNVADAQPFVAHLHRPAISHADWFAGIPANMLASTAIASWSLPLFRYILALVWFVTAALSFGIYPVSGSLALLQPLGLSGAPAMFMLMAASSLDLCLGLATLFWPKRILWLMQIALIVGYSCIIAIYSPEYYLHPFGPVLKNLPILALLAFLFAHQRDAQ